LPPLSRRETAILLAIVAGSLIARCAFACGVDIFQDEAIYWWQAGEGLSFAPQPPVVALLAKVGTALAGQSVPALRLGALLAGTAGILAAWLLGRELAGPRAGLWSAALFATCPMFLAAGAVLTPDGPLFVCWLLFVWTAWRGLHTDGLGWWLLAGLLFALGVYSKYMMVLAGPSLVVALLTTREGRAALRRPGPWLAGLVGAGLFVPVFLIWDHAHGWAAISYHLKSRHHWGFEPSLVRDYVLGHAGAVTPVLLVAVIWALARWAMLWRRGDARGAWLLSFSVFPVAFFLVPSLGTESFMWRVHWDAVGYATALVALGCLLGGGDLVERVRRRWRRVSVVGLAVAGLAVAVLIAVAAFPCTALHAGLSRPPLRTVLGWRELAAKVREREEAWSGPDRFIVTESFNTALCLGFHLDRREGIYCLPHSRNRRYGLEEALNEWGIDWQTMVREQTGRPALYVGQWHWSRGRADRRLPQILYAFFPVATEEDSVVLTCGGLRLGYLQLCHCPELRPVPRVLERMEDRSAGALEDYEPGDDGRRGREPDGQTAFAVEGKGSDDT
jgi:hypothetical protein